MKKILLSGVKPTGRPHIGNYFGAMKQYVALQNEYQSFVFVADLHALTTLHNPSELIRNTLDVAIDYLAIGLDPNKTTLFKQSDVPQVTELTWIFNCISAMSYLMRSHAYKDAVQNAKEVSVGTFDYPMLMAADILIADADLVPVGQDQKQHVEYARDTAEKFNYLFGQTFKLPSALILDSVKTVPGTDGRKMSKSYNNTIDLFAGDREIESAVMKIPTDSRSINEPKDPAKSTLFSLLELFVESARISQLRERYTSGGLGYKETKDILIEEMKRLISPLRERRADIATDKKKIADILIDGGARCRKLYEAKMDIVRQRTGLVLA